MINKKGKGGGLFFIIIIIIIAYLYFRGMDNTKNDAGMFSEKFMNLFKDKDNSNLGLVPCRTNLECNERISDCSSNCTCLEGICQILS